MMTGLRPENTQVFDNNDARLASEVFARVMTLPEHFRDSGYETVRIGKIAHDDHEKEAWSRIVFRGEGIEPDATGKKPTKKAEMRPARGPHSVPGSKYTGAPFLYGPSGLEDKEHDDYHTAGAAINILRQKHEKPLFLAVGFHSDHLPMQAPDKYFDMYPADKIELPDVPGAGPDGLPTKKISVAIGKESAFNATGFNNPATIEQWREAIAAHYACLTFVDVQIGRVLAALDETGRADDTIVVLWSDHGFMLGEHFFWRKGQLYDLSTKSAFIIRTPLANSAGKVCNRIVESADIYPSLAELCGLSKPESIDGVSFVPLIKNPELPWKKAALIYRESGQAVGLTTERWRYNRVQDHPERDALYDHDVDPGENVNLIKDPRYATLVKELSRLVDVGWKGCLPES